MQAMKEYDSLLENEMKDFVSFSNGSRWYFALILGADRTARQKAKPNAKSDPGGIISVFTSRLHASYGKLINSADCKNCALKQMYIKTDYLSAQIDVVILCLSVRVLKNLTNKGSQWYAD